MRQALSRGWEVTAFCRNPEKLQGLLAGAPADRLRIVQGDARDGAAVAAAVALGHDCVLVSLGGNGIMAPDSVCSEVSLAGVIAH